jgi:hypothetical protein
MARPLRGHGRGGGRPGRPDLRGGFHQPGADPEVPGAAGISLIAADGGGLYWLVPGLVLGFAGAVLNAWILLVEIHR